MCENKDTCCHLLEAEAIHTNQQLLDLNIRSKDLHWQEYVIPVQPREHSFYLERQFDMMSNYRQPIDRSNRRKILLVHDMMGNYLEDKYYHGSKKFDDYRFYHWAGIDYFCYFSHNYITIPPSGWINAAHLHGVPVLGTFITEGATGTTLLHEILHSRQMIKDVASAMVSLCKHYQFDGWFINIECRVKPQVMENLIYFVKKLRDYMYELMSSELVIWYDSIIEGGLLFWQNEINIRNVRFSKTTNGTFVNYAWNDRNLQATRTTCEREQLPLGNVFFGIDIFGRNQVAKFNTKQTLERIVREHFSIGIFAPAWTYETLQQYGYDIKQPLGDEGVNEAFLMRNEKFWSSLWEHLGTHEYVNMPFYTHFCLGSGKQTYVNGVPNTIAPMPFQVSKYYDVYGVQHPMPLIEKTVGNFFNLSRQTLQPSVPLHDKAKRYYDDAFNGGSCLRIEHCETSFRLFCTNLEITRAGMVFAYAYKLDEDGEIDCILRICTNDNRKDCYVFLGRYSQPKLDHGRYYLAPFNQKYNELLTGSLQCSLIPKEMALTEYKANGWGVRYYVMELDGHIQVKDIGVLYRKDPGAEDAAYLGAVYLNQFDPNRYNFPVDSNKTFLRIYGQTE